MVCRAGAPVNSRNYRSYTVHTGISALQIRCFRRFVPRPARQAQASSEACHVRDDLFSAPVLVEAAYAVRSPKHVRHPPDQVCLDIGPRFVY